MKKIIKRILIAIPIIMVIAFGIITVIIPRRMYTSSIEANKKDVNTCLTSDSKKRTSVVTYKPCNKDFKLADWTKEYGNKNSKTTVIWIHGGPTVQFFGRKGPSEYSQALKENLEKHHTVFLRQTWHVKQYLGNAKNISANVASKELKESMEIIDKAINHYQKKGQRVVLIGHSFGSYLVNAYLYNYGAKADYTISMAAKLVLLDKDVMTKVYDNLEAGKKNRKLIRFNKQNQLIQKEFSVPIYAWAVMKYNWTTYDVVGRLNIGLYDHFENNFAGPNNKLKENSNVLWITAHYDPNTGWFDQDMQNVAKRYGKLMVVDKDDLIALRSRLDKKNQKKDLAKLAHRSMVKDDILIKEWFEIAGL